MRNPALEMSFPAAGKSGVLASSFDFTPREGERNGESEASPPAASTRAADEAQAFPAGAITFEDIVTRYHHKVFQLVYRYTGDYEEACDLTQDTFVRAFRAWDEFRGDAQIYTWLYRIALNLCHNQRKKGDRKKRVEGPSLDAAIGENDDLRPFDVADARPQPSRAVENDELRARLHEALHRLPANYRTVIVLRDIEGLSYEEIAAVTDSSLEAIKSRLFRARGLLRELLSPYLFGAGETQNKKTSRTIQKKEPRRLNWRFGKTSD